MSRSACLHVERILAEGPHDGAVLLQRDDELVRSDQQDETGGPPAVSQAGAGSGWGNASPRYPGMHVPLSTASLTLLTVANSMVTDRPLIEVLEFSMRPYR